MRGRNEELESRKSFLASWRLARWIVDGELLLSIESTALTEFEGHMDWNLHRFYIIMYTNFIVSQSEHNKKKNNTSSPQSLRIVIF